MFLGGAATAIAGGRTGSPFLGESVGRWARGVFGFAHLKHISHVELEGVWARLSVGLLASFSFPIWRRTEAVHQNSGTHDVLRILYTIGELLLLIFLTEADRQAVLYASV